IATGGNVLLAQYQFEDNSKDNSAQLLHGAVFGTATYTTGKTGQKAIILNGTNTAIQLPSNIANSSNITVAGWVYPRSTNTWQRIFDFGNGDSQYMFLTHRASTGQLRFAIKNGGAEQILNAPTLTLNKWSHVAVTLDETSVRIYVNGQQTATSSTITIRPSDFKPLLNYIGRSQFPDPLFNGYIDDFRIYNYALPAEDIMKLTEVISGTEDIRTESNNLKIWPSPATFEFNMKYEKSSYSGKSRVSVFNSAGHVILQSEISGNATETFNTKEFPPGIYFVRISNPNEIIIQKLVVK
ncbi:MAG: T9SS type A sorting domain-containing protein, partial [Paludibacter sp.]|nr:T9SS type A sorting domain-containing protein [Paludibacter sp.]